MLHGILLHSPIKLTRNSDSVLPNTAVNRSFAAFFSTMKKSAKNKYSLQLLSNNVKCILRNRLSNEYCKIRKNKNNYLMIIVPFLQLTVASRRGVTSKAKLANLNSVK